MPRRTIDVEALETLYRAHLAQYVRAAAAIVGDEGGGSDAVQEAFAIAVRKRATFRGDAPLEAWVWRIVINEARAVRRRRMPELEWDVESLITASATSDRDEDAEIRAWIAALPEQQRLAVFLRYFADLDYRSIAAVLEVAVGTVSATLAAAHGALRCSLEEVVP